MQRSLVRLPPTVRQPYTVFLNGVEQREGVDYEIGDGVLIFPAELHKEERLSVWRWFWGIWGVGTYGPNDQVDVAWEVDGRPRIAHALDIERVPDAGDPAE